MKAITLTGLRISGISIADDSITLTFADKPNKPEVKVAASEPKAPVSQTVSEFFRGIQKKGVVTKLATTTPEQRTAHAQKMNRIRWSRRNGKSAAQIENEAAKQIVGSLFEIAKKNEAVKNI